MYTLTELLIFLVIWVWVFFFFALYFCYYCCWLNLLFFMVVSIKCVVRCGVVWPIYFFICFLIWSCRQFHIYCNYFLLFIVQPLRLLLSRLVLFFYWCAQCEFIDMADVFARRFFFFFFSFKLIHLLLLLFFSLIIKCTSYTLRIHVHCINEHRHMKQRRRSTIVWLMRDFYLKYSRMNNTVVSGFNTHWNYHW